ncbi:MAG TPA: ABC transporter permease [Planctomycetaceae bacterium]|jgi:ABC-2 type transport system permease protein|nr:ABC transporter permease [Planctomycetaceae bacterium]
MTAPVAESLPRTLNPALGRRPPASSRLVALWSVYVLTLRQHLHGKRWMVIAGMCVLCVGLVVLVRATAPDLPSLMIEFNFGFMFIPQAVLPLIALIYASGIVQDEQEEQTMTYLLIRPIPKWALYSAKLLATLTTTVILVVGLTALTYAAVYVGSKTEIKEASYRALQAASIHSLAVIAYCCLFGLISLLTKRILIVGILYALFLEGLLANMPFSIRLATVIYYTRLIAYRSMSFVTGMPGNPSRTTDIAAEIWQLDVHADPGLLDHPQMRTCLIVLLVASAVCSVLAAVIFSQREFHVKTPEKA